MTKYSYENIYNVAQKFNDKDIADKGVRNGLADDMMAALGFKKVSSRYEDGGLMSLSEVASYYGDSIVSIGNHVTTIVDGAVLDTWDCTKTKAGSERKAKMVWVKERAQ